MSGWGRGRSTLQTKTKMIEQMPSFEVTTKLYILEEEVEKSIKPIKYWKRTGPDELSVEALKALDVTNTDITTNSSNAIYNCGRIQVEMMLSIFVTI